MIRIMHLHNDYAKFMQNFMQSLCKIGALCHNLDSESCPQDPGILLNKRGEIEIKGKGRMVTFWIPDKQDERETLWKNEGWNRPMEEHPADQSLEQDVHHDIGTGSVKIACENGNAYLYTQNVMSLLY